ncbi:hypothetical protein HK414_07395 [Ramlibacter terrae]|uniref:Uncharacterized protein n=1 Tax=Ramlibacter terrae TaxID=2732511 RepID=A0ABX6P2C2_9BURK|nr:hypothetical protein HK414_07395 [Ramlibacter terrae]
MGDAAALPGGFASPDAVRAVAARLRAEGAPAVLVLRAGTGATGLLHWLDTPHARGWLRPAGGDAEALRADADTVAARLDAALKPASSPPTRPSWRASTVNCRSCLGRRAVLPAAPGRVFRSGPLCDRRQRRATAARARRGRRHRAAAHQAAAGRRRALVGRAAR